MADQSEQLYAALPAVIRSRDADAGEPLRALLELFESQLNQIRDETDTTWNNWFIETCEEWLVPYIGDALGVRGLRSIDATNFSQRAFVANTIAYRRRKGTAVGLEQLARDLTQYPARVVEYFRRTAVDYHPQVPLRHSLTTVDLRDPLALDDLGGPFSEQPHTPELRRIEARRGRHNIGNVGVHLWRSLAWRIVQSSPRAIAGAPGWFHFDPHGRTLNLGNQPEPEASIEVLAERRHVPHALGLLELAATQVEGPIDGIPGPLLAADDETLAVWVDDGDELRALARRVCHLDGDPAVSARSAVTGVALVDPVRGRLLVHADDLGASPGAIRVDYWQCHAAQIGAGTWDRDASFEAALGPDAPTWGRVVGGEGTSELPEASDLDVAIAAWNSHAASTEAAIGVIALVDNRSHEGPITGIEIPAGARLIIVAASADSTRLELIASGRRGVVLGGLTVAGQPSTIPGSGQALGELVLDGLSLEGAVEVSVGELGRLRLNHCTIALGPSDPALVVRSDASGTNGDLELVGERCSITAVECEGPIGGLTLVDSIVAGPVVLPGSELFAAGVTFLDEVAVELLEASNSIFAAILHCKREQRGCLRFCYVPPGSRTPRRYRCEPDQAVSEGVESIRVRPVFESLDPTHWAYARLRDDAAVQLRFGSESESEMGAYHHLQHGRRLANLRTVLEQYLRHGLAAGIFPEN